MCSEEIHQWWKYASLFNQNFYSDEIAQMVEQRTVEPAVPGSNPATGEFFCAMLQRVTSDRVYEIPTKQMYNGLWVYKAQ